MLIVSEAIARSARQREESRGAHSRIDFPDLDEEWGKKNSVVRLGTTAWRSERRRCRRCLTSSAG